MKRTIRFIALWLALVSLLPRALIPAGWMPDPAPSGGALVTLCTVNGPVHMRLAPDEQPVKPRHEHSDVCPFAAAPHFAVAPSSFVQASLMIAPVRRVVIVRSSPSGIGDWHSPQAPRAPPQIV